MHTAWLRIFTSRTDPTEMCSWIQKTCVRMFMAALILMDPNWKQPQCPPTAEEMNPLWYIHATEHWTKCSYPQQHECISQTSCWVKETRQKNTHHVIPLKVQKQAKLICGVRSQASSFLWGGWQQEHTREFLGVGVGGVLIFCFMIWVLTTGEIPFVKFNLGVHVLFMNFVYVLPQ